MSKLSEGLVIPVSWYLGVLGQLVEAGPQCPNFSRIVKFYYPDIWSFNFAIQNGLNYLFWASGSRDIC